MTFRQACAFVAEHHRHNPPARGHKFSIGLARDDQLVGVAMVGRPIARHFDDGLTAEVNRTCVLDDVPNGNSMLYGACWRAARAMGYLKLITYTRSDESGASLRGAGWRVIAERDARKSWAESTADDRLAAMRSQIGSGGVQRTLWEIA